MSLYCKFKNDNDVLIKLIDHPFTANFCLRDNHEVMFRRINTFLINNNIIKKNIIDLGAWIGDNSIPWAKNIKDIVYAIDPSHDNCEYIRSTCKINEIENVSVLQYAISYTNELLSTNENLHHCSFVYNNPGKTGINKLNAVSLDYLHDQNKIENIGYIHLDVEGMEHKVLQGSVNIIEKYRPIITFEQHLEIDDYSVISTFLKDRNYKVFLIDELLPGCRPDCRNSIAFPDKSYEKEINEHIGRKILLPK